MRILTWSYAFWPGGGGLERIVGQVTAGLAARGHELAVIAQPISEVARTYPSMTGLDGDPAQWSRFGEVPVHRFPIIDAVEARDAAGLARITAAVRGIRREFAADVVHLAMFSGDGLIAAATDDGAPTVVANHQAGLVVTGAGTSATERVMRKARLAVAVSDSVRRETAGHFPAVADRIRVIPNAVEVTAGVGPIPEGPPMILASGRFVGEKGFHTLLVAFQLLLDRHPHARLVLAGDGYGRAGLEDLTRRLSLTDKVTFTGWASREQMIDLVAASTLVAVPSIWAEPFGLVALEASERGRPVVVSRVGGLPEIVLHGETGLHAEAGDPFAWAATMDFLLADPALAARLGAAGRHRAHQEFSLERCLDRYEAVFAEAQS